MEKRDVWFLEMDDILIPLDRVYRIGKNKETHVPVEKGQQLQANISHINANLRFIARSVNENYAVVYMPKAFDKPFIMSFYKDEPIMVNDKLVQTAFLKEDDIFKVHGFSEVKNPFVVKKESIEQKEGLKAMLLGAVNKDNISGYENSVHAFRGMLLKKGAKSENIKTYIDKDAQRFNIRNSLENMVEGSSIYDTTIFYYSGHAGKNGLELFGYDSMEMESVYRLFNKIKGKKVVVLDCCYSINQLPGLVSSAYFLGASREKAYSQEYNISMGNFTRLLLKEINTRDYIDLADLRENDFNQKFCEIVSETAKTQRVYFKGPSLYL